MIIGKVKGRSPAIKLGTWIENPCANYTYKECERDYEQSKI